MSAPPYRFRPLTRPGETPPLERARSPFRATYGDTLAELAGELRALEARGEVVIELDLTEREIRRDGLPYSKARPRSPAVALAFACRWGPMRLATDRFDDWQANLRAIALALGDLRRLDRYGIGRSGEQYRGWLALEAGPRLDERRGRDLIERHGGVRAALRATHPDHGGDPVDFAAVQAARAAMSAEASS